MGISNRMDKTNNFYTLSKKFVHTSKKRYSLRLERDQAAMKIDILLHTEGKRFKTHNHLMVLENDTK